MKQADERNETYKPNSIFERWEINWLQNIAKKEKLYKTFKHFITCIQ